MTKICSAFLTAQFPTCDLISLSSHLFCISFHCCLNHFYDAHGFHSILIFLLVEMSAQWRARVIGHWLEHGVLFEHQEALLCCASDRAPEQLAWRDCGFSSLEELPGCGRWQCAVGVPAWAVVAQRPRAAFWTHPPVVVVTVGSGSVRKKVSAPTQDKKKNWVLLSVEMLKSFTLSAV